MSNLGLTEKQSILVLGAAGRTGLECIFSLSQHPQRPDIHAFCKNTDLLDDSAWVLCKSVIEGSTRHAVDIEEALNSSNANWVILTVGTGNDVGPSNIRTTTAVNIARLLRKPEFQHIQVIVVSMAPSHGTFTKYHLRHVLADHKGQELALSNLGRRVLFVRSTRFFDTRSMIEEKGNKKHHRRNSTSSVSLVSESSSDSNTSVTSDFELTSTSHDQELTNKTKKMKCESSVSAKDSELERFRISESRRRTITRTAVAASITAMIFDENLLVNFIESKVASYERISRHSTGLVVNANALSLFVR